MKTFLVILKEKSKKQLDKNLLHRHIEHLKQLTQSGHLLMCGPFADDSGAMLVLQANSHSDAENLIQADPFIEEAFYGDYSITEFYSANEANKYLMSHDQTINELNRQ